MKQRDLIKRLEAAGYHKARGDGNHIVYKKPSSQFVAVPRHREVNEDTAKSILGVVGLR